MVWNIWGEGTPLVLLHGGYGSWMHWVRNVDALASRFRLLVPDLPGMGESALPPEPHSADGVAAILADGLDRILGRSAPIDLVGFSFGSGIGGHLAALRPERVSSYTAVGPVGLGLTRSDRPRYGKVDKTMTDARRRAVHAGNLAMLMLHHRDGIDDLAVHIQDENTRMSRLKSSLITQKNTLGDTLRRLHCRVNAVFGAEDVTSVPYMQERFDFFAALHRPTTPVLIENAGHWVQFEAAERFNATLLKLLRDKT